MGTTSSIAATWGLLWGLWLLFTGTLAVQEAGTGLVLAGALAVATGGSLFRDGPQVLQPRRLLLLLLYVPVLAMAIVRANLQIARIVVDPRLPIRPGIVKVRTRLTNPVGRLALANSITLTPGTLSVEMEGDELYIHWVVVEGTDIEEATRRIVADFEKYLGEIFG